MNKNEEKVTVSFSTRKYMSIIQFASLGGKARAKKYTKKQLSEMGKKGGRPKANHAKSRNGGSKKI